MYRTMKFYHVQLCHGFLSACNYCIMGVAHKLGMRDFEEAYHLASILNKGATEEYLWDCPIIPPLSPIKYFKAYRKFLKAVTS